MIEVAGITKDNAGEVFVHLGGVSPASNFLSVKGLRRFQREVAAADEDGSCDLAVDWFQKGECALLQANGGDIEFEIKSLDLKGSTGAYVAQLTVARVTVRSTADFTFDSDFLTQGSDLERNGDGLVGVGNGYGSGIGLETIGGGFDGVGARLQIWRSEAALWVGVKGERRGEIAT